ncbi:MAG: cytidylate kinase-like family protein [Desulfobacteraceae bacterium]|jgi:cytidylate kinase
MSVITISRQFGAGGLTLGKKLAENLAYTLIDEDIIQLISKKAKVSQDWVHAIEKEAGGKLHQFINRLIPKGVVDRILDDQRGYIDEEIYIHLLDQIIRQIADKDNCIIIGRGGQYILKDRPDTVHILLIADKADRISFMETHYGLELPQATQVVNAEDKRRTNLYRKFDKSDYDRPAHYHFTLNTSRISLDDAAAIIRQYMAGR